MANPLEKTRIFGVAAHIDAGKTTVSERMLVLAGVQHRPGRVDEGTAVMDWEEEERERGITIHSAAIDLPWRDWDFTLVDTPGHIDFTVEVERCMRVLDGVVLVFDAAKGVEAQSETVWRQAARHGVRRIGFLNKLDKVGADWDGSLRTIEEKLGEFPLPLQVPLEISEGRIRLLDLVEGKVLDHRFGPGGEVLESVDPSGEERERLSLERESLIEILAERDEVLLEIFAGGGEVGPEEIRAAVRRCTLRREVFPVLGGAALKGVGVEALLDAVARYLPNPLETEAPRARTAGRKEQVIELRPDPGLPLVARIFKIIATRHGPQCWTRLYQGSLRTGQQVRIPRVRRPGRVQGLWAIEADRTRQMERAEAGRIVAMHGLPDVRTGDTVCDPSKVCELDPWEFPSPVISMAVEARRSDDRDRLVQALDMIRIEDPTMSWRQDEETGQLLISGMGELHLQILAGRLEREFRLDLGLGTPRVAFRESLLRPVRRKERVRRSFSGREIDVRLDLELLPDPEADPALVEAGPALAGDLESWKANLVEVALSAVRLDLAGGFAHGYPVIRLRAVLHELEPGEPGRHPQADEVEAACSLLLREAGRGPEVCLLEPWMRVEVQVPEVHLSPILADLQAHGGEVSSVQVRGENAEVRGCAPLSKLLDYSTRIRSLTQGRAGASLFLSDWRPVREGA